jgi:hypothetical protein
MAEVQDRNAGRVLRRGSACAPLAVEGLAAELGRLKLRPRLLRTPTGYTAGGATLRIRVCELLCSEPAREKLLQRLVLLLQQRVPVTLSLSGFGAGDRAIGALEVLCGLLRDRLKAAGLSTEALGVSVHSHVLPLPAFALICGALLGGGARYVVLDGLQLRHHKDERARSEAERNWSFLWQRRELPPALAPAYASSVTTRCPLLGDEAAVAVLPELGLQVPPETAWLPLEVDVTDFSDGHGRLHLTELEEALRVGVDKADVLLDRLDWPLPELAADAWQNRRLAVSVGGIGDLVAERGVDPGDLRTLQWVDRVVTRMHTALWQRSRTRALAAEPLPALLRTDPGAAFSCDVHRCDWQVRWRRALANAAVRHRNMLVMSPYAVFPKAARGVAGYADLLPVLHHADAFGFSAPRGDVFRNRSEFKSFHRRAWAVMQRRNAASLVAAGV